MPGPVAIRELSPTDFRVEAETLLAVYTAAMRPEPAHLPGRLSIMERHASHPGFRAVTARDEDSGDIPAADLPPGQAGSRIVAFCYGFRGTPGQWWHDVVRSGLTATCGPATANAWLADPLEIAEVHVRPQYQHQGIGRQMMLMLAAGRSERTAVLSTQDGESPARHLYRSLGFTDLLTGFSFPGGGPPYAVMGAILPLGGQPRP